jgi:hypothetical protein
MRLGEPDAAAAGGMGTAPEYSVPELWCLDICCGFCCDATRLLPLDRHFLSEPSLLLFLGCYCSFKPMCYSGSSSICSICSCYQAAACDLPLVTQQWWIWAQQEHCPTCDSLCFVIVIANYVICYDLL